MSYPNQIRFLTREQATAGGTWVTYIPNAAKLSWSNAAGNAYINGVYLDSSNVLNIDNNLGAVVINCALLQTVKITYNGGTNIEAGNGYLAIGANPATTGGVRLRNNGGVFARNAANSANIQILNLTALNWVAFGSASAVLCSYACASAGDHRFTINSAQQFRITEKGIVLPTCSSAPTGSDLANGETILYNDGTNIQWIKKDSGGNVSTGTLI